MISRATVKFLARRGVASLTYYSGGCLLMQGMKRHHSVRVMVYHSISKTPSSTFAVHTDNFEDQMRFIAEKFNVVSMDDLARYVKDQVPIPPWSIAVTIDDGYEDSYTDAYPILKKYNIPATIFLSTA